MCIAYQCSINRNVDRLICSSTSRQLFSQKIFPIRILFFTLKTIWAFEEWCFTDTPAFSSFFLFSQVLSGVWPSHLDLDTGVTDQFKENHYLKMLEIKLQSQNGLCSSLQCWQHGEDLQASGGWDRLMVKCQLSLCKMCVSLDDPALVVPWMGAADQILSPILVQNVCHLWWPCPCGSLDGTSWPDVWMFNLSENSSGKWNGQLSPSKFAQIFLKVKLLC